MISELNIPKQANVDVQGLIRQYQIEEGNNVNAGDLCNFINNFTQKDNKELTGYYSKHVQAKPLEAGYSIDSEDKIIVYYTAFGSSSSNYEYLYAYIVKIDRETGAITLGNRTSLASSSDTMAYFDLDILSSTSCCFAYVNVGSNHNYLYVGTISISDTTITPDGATIINSNTDESGIAICALSSNKFCVEWRSEVDYTYTNYMTVCTGSGSSITHGTNLTLPSAYSDYGISLAKISSTRLYYTYQDKTSRSLMYNFYNISGTSITSSDNGTITTGTSSNYVQQSYSIMQNYNGVNYIGTLYYKYGISKIYFYQQSPNNMSYEILPSASIPLTSAGVKMITCKPYKNTKILISAIEQSSGNVYIYDMANNNIENIVNINSIENSGIDTLTLYPLFNESIIVVCGKSGKESCYSFDNSAKKVKSSTTSLVDCYATESGTGGDSIDVKVPYVG